MNFDSLSVIEIFESVLSHCEEIRFSMLRFYFITQPTPPFSLLLNCKWLYMSKKPVFGKSTGIFSQLTLKCDQISYLGVFEVAEHENEVNKRSGWYWGAGSEVLHPSFDATYLNFGPIPVIKLFPEACLS